MRPNSKAKKGVKTASYYTSYLKKGQIGNDAYNYEEKYPEDAIYEETTSNARVWRTYEDESRIHDANMVEESRDNVDVLLVFVSLHSHLFVSPLNMFQGGSFLGGRHDFCRPDIPKFAGELRGHVSFSSL